MNASQRAVVSGARRREAQNRLYSDNERAARTDITFNGRLSDDSSDLRPLSPLFFVNTKGSLCLASGPRRCLHAYFEGVPIYHDYERAKMIKEEEWLELKRGNKAPCCAVS